MMDVRGSAIGAWVKNAFDRAEIDNSFGQGAPSDPRICSAPRTFGADPGYEF